MKLQHISADSLLQDAFALALQVLESNFLPDLIVGIWRGGAPIAVAVHEAFEFTGHHCDHMALHSSSYTGIATKQAVQIQGLQLLREKATAAARILLVDDVFDSGQSMATILNEVQRSCGAKVCDIRIAVPYYKPANNTTTFTPDYFLHETAAWLVFPHELSGLDNAELKRKPGLAALAERLLALRARHSKTDK